MLPKTELVYSRVYNSQLNKGLSEKKKAGLYDELKENAAGFERLYARHITEVLGLVEKCSGFKWKKKHLPIYVVNSPGGLSFFEPLTLNYHKNAKLMFLVLVHQLAHNIFPGSGAYNEAAINLIVRHVAQAINLGAGRELKTMEHYQEERFKNYKKLDYDLNKKSLKAWEKGKRLGEM